jgi:hypothetical protein
MIKNIRKKDDYVITLGFAEKPNKNDFNLESFPSKVGGKPVNNYKFNILNN